MDKNNRAERAAKLFANGYNCCQAALCAFAGDLGVDEETLYKVSEGFGSGMGTGNGVCGACIGAGMVAGLANSDGDITNPGQTKNKSRSIAADIQRKFVEEAGALICKEIKTGNDGKMFTSCEACVRIAVRAAEEALGL